MNRINQLFTDKKQGILSVYFVAGYPETKSTTEIIRELQKQGADMIEVGIPFSDPMADGPVIQAAATKALRSGMSLQLLFDQLSDIRPQVQLPLILMGYLNPVMQYGFENFCKQCQKTGVDGMIIPDLPFQDYLDRYKPIADRYDLRVIMLITPETSDERIRLIDEHTAGFIYMVSSASVTGAQTDFDDQKRAYFSRIAAMNLRNPRLVGFGISNRQTLESASAFSSGAIVGSKFVQLLDQTATIPQAVGGLFEALNR